EGFTTRRVPDEHAGGKWRLSYQSFTGQSGNLEVDLNFMFRQPLWDIQPADSHPFGDFQARSIPVLDLHELAAGKLAALLSRRQARDLFDCHRILNMDDLERDRLRIAFVVYGGMNRRDWRTVSIEDVDFDPAELTSLLIPTLDTRAIQEQGSPAEFGARLVRECPSTNQFWALASFQSRNENFCARSRKSRDYAEAYLKYAAQVIPQIDAEIAEKGHLWMETRECREGLGVVLPFNDAEREFLDLLLDKGEIDSTLLTANETLQKRIQQQPLLEWKALNVKKHKGLS
ncbi:MAG: nucleotidyl transferase AbiEii/AbiGii toxin family protein, partial [Deltaproteobacteria bacterium]|nr:nucleotidyl transferase AbiEii/AbiGii toxin family protein [Deltaproteobacteria bacterium]